LVVTAAVKQSMAGASDTASVDSRVTNLSVAVSVFYLLLAFVAPLTWRFLEQNPVSALETSTFFLALVQSLVGVALGVFFLTPGKTAEPVGARK
jgi:hypothetical protein